MSTNSLERLDGAGTQHADVAAGLRSQYLDEKNIIKIDLKQGGLNEPRFLEMGNPFVKSDPFSREGFDDSKDFGDKVMHGFKKLFGHDDSLGDQVKKYVEGKMSPEDQKELKKEEELYKSEQQKHWADCNIMGSNSDMPDLKHDPRFAMMRKRDDLVQQEEDSIRKTVEGKMTGLMPDVKKEMKEYEESYKIHNPMGTGEGFGPHKVGSTLQAYYDQIRKETERRLTGGET